LRGGEWLRELIDARFDRVAAAEEFHVDQRDVRIADDALFLQVAKDRRRALSVSDFDELRLLAESFVGRGEGAEDERRAAGEKDDGEDGDRAEGGEVLAATAAVASAGYDALRFCASRYD
jgi:hypothetical protein